MKKTLIFVSSIDGKITKWGQSAIRLWSSKDDQDFFDSVFDTTRVILMGRTTYDSSPVTPSDKHLFMVLTRHPHKYEDKRVPGKLEFIDRKPAEIVESLEREGEEKMLILGGPDIATQFLKEQLIDEILLTFEPRIFGTGGNFAAGEKLDIRLKLLSCTRANETGTIFLRYEVITSPLPPSKWERI